MLTREEYLLVKCAEEAVEVAQRADKALCFGLGEVQAHIGQNPERFNNAERLVGEIVDLLGVIDLMVREGLIVMPGPAKLQELKLAKQSKIEHYMNVSRAQGCLEPA